MILARHWQVLTFGSDTRVRVVSFFETTLTKFISNRAYRLCSDEEIKLRPSVQIGV